MTSHCSSLPSHRTSAKSCVDNGKARPAVSDNAQPGSTMPWQCTAHLSQLFGRFAYLKLREQVLTLIRNVR
jgi:hypothetical protein